MKEGTLTLGTFFGIPLKLHWSFALLLLYVFYNVYSENNFLFLWYVLFLFFCVVLHEYGHALMAKKYEIKTKDIILSPIGGVARLEALPEKPTQELAIAIAGPLVNFILALVIAGIIFFGRNSAVFFPEDLVVSNTIDEYLRLGFVTNVVLFLFNLVPAFPMDGGRVLRALLAIKLGRSRATTVASIIGRIIAICFIVYGLYHEDYLFALLGVFVFSMAGAESRDVNTTEKLSTAIVNDFMKTNFTKLHIGDKMSVPFDLLKRTGESNFLVYNSLGYIAGYLPAFFIIDANKKGLLDESCNQWLSDNIQYISPSSTLKEAFEIMNKNGTAILGIKDENDQVIAILDRDAVTRAIAIL